MLNSIYSVISNTALVILISVAMCMTLPSFFTNPAANYTTVKPLQNYGYEVESHYVVTPDGYILNLHRIPSGKQNKSNGKVVYLSHGLWSSSMQYVIPGHENSFAFKLADEGYDVWLANNRGNKHSRNHTILNPDSDSKFWDFSWHEIAINDLPASIDYILNKTKKSKLHYVGLSQGSLVLCVLLSEIPQYNLKIEVAVFVAPVVFVKNMKSPFFTYPASLLRILEPMIHITNGAEAFASHSFTNKLLSILCSSNFGKTFCVKMTFTFFGYSPMETNETLLPTAISQILSGSSTKQFLHYLQCINSGYFRKFDYGTSENLVRYGQRTPPDYDLRKVIAPTYLIYSSNDLLTDHVEDVPNFCNALGNCIEKHLIPEFNHIDFVIGKNVHNIVYNLTMKYLSQH